MNTSGDDRGFCVADGGFRRGYLLQIRDSRSAIRNALAFLAWGAVSLAIPIAWFVLVSKYALPLKVLEYDTDEGLNLMKAMLVGRGHHLYTEIWNDQPPLFTYILCAVFRFTGPSVEAARLAVLAMSSLLMVSLFHILRRLESWLAGALALTLLAGAPLYMRASYAVMIGLPAVSLAFVALALAVEHRHVGDTTRIRRWCWWVLAGLCGIVMALSLLTKLFTATFAILPLAVLLLPMPPGRGFPHPRYLRQLLAAGVALAAGAATFGLVVWRLHLSYTQLITTHSIARTRTIPGDFNFLQQLEALWTQHPLLFIAAGAFILLMAIPDRFHRAGRWSRGLGVLAVAVALLIVHFIGAPRFDHFLADLPTRLLRLHADHPWLIRAFASLAVAGVIAFRPARALPILAMVFACLGLQAHYPVWVHQLLLVLVPLCWLAGAAIACPVDDLRDLLSAIRIPRWPRVSRWAFHGLGIAISLAAGLMFCWWWTTHAILPARQSALRDLYRGTGDTPLVKAIRQNAAKTKWMYSDRPIYSFRAGVPVIPSLAVNSEKRRLTGNLTDRQILDEIRRCKPEQVLLSRFGYSREVRNYLNSNYRRYFVEGGELYILPNLDRPASTRGRWR